MDYQKQFNCLVRIGVSSGLCQGEAWLFALDWIRENYICEGAK